MKTLLRAEHLRRGALVYFAPVHGAAARNGLQQSLLGLAQARGFASLTLIDDRRCQPGSSPVERPGFGRLLSLVCGGAGAVFVVDAAQLALGRRPWRRFVELCALGGTLLIDRDHEYDPRHVCARRALGLSARRDAAALTQLPGPVAAATPSPADAGARRLSSVAQLVALKLRRLGSVEAVVAWAIAAGLKVPLVSPTATGSSIRWEEPSRSSVLRLVQFAEFDGCPGVNRLASCVTAP